MQVETYEEITIDEQGGDVVNEVVSGEALALIESLGLEGQKAFVSKTVVDDEDVERRIPYREITLEESRIFLTLFPQRTKLAAYSAGPVPLRVLQVAAHATECGVTHLEVWHSRIPAADPVLVGNSKHPTRTWDTRVLLLARWGTSLASLDELREQATKTLTTKVRAELESGRARIDAALQSIDSLVALHLRGESAEFPSLHLMIPG